MGTKTMCKQVGLLTRTNAYYFQARIPKDCTQHFPKPLIRERLTATTLAEAKAQVRQKWAELEAQLATFRNGSSAVPSRDDLKRYADAWLASLLEEDEEVRMEGLTDRDYRKKAETLDIVDAAGRYELARGLTETTEFEMEDFLESAFGVRLVKGTPAYREAAYAFLKASVKATELMKARHNGAVVETPEAPPLPTHKAPARATTDAPLLPWKPSKGKASYNAEKWFIDFLRSAGLRDDTPGRRLVGMHAFTRFDPVMNCMNINFVFGLADS